MLFRWLGLIALLCSFISPAHSGTASDPAWFSAPPGLASSFVQIENLPDDQWQALPASGMLNQGFFGNSLWLSTHYTPELAGRQILELSNPQHDRITLYILRSDAPPEIQLGGFRQTAKDTPSDFSHNQLFDFQLLPGQSVRLYLHVESSRPLFVWPRLSSDSEFARAHSVERFWLGLYFGLFVALCLYSLMAWATTRDDNYSDYFLFLSLMGLVHGQMLGLWHELLLHPYPQLMDFLSTFIPTLGLAAFCRFARNYLDLNNQSPRLYRLLTRCMWAPIVLILPVYALAGSPLSIPLCDLLSLLLSAICIATGLKLWQRGYRPAHYYLLSQIPLVAGGLVYVSANMGIVPATALSMYSFQFGAGLSTIMLALALAGKVRALQKQHLQAQSDRLIAEQQMIEVLRESEAELEKRVAERTHQLEEALALQRQQHETLERNNRSLAALHEERGAFLQIAAHDLKNPTAAIISYADLLRERWQAWDEEKKLKRIGNIRQLAQLAFDIIRRLLDIDAIENGHYAFRPTTLNAADSLRAVSENYRDRCEAKDLRLHLNLCAEPLQIRADKTAFHQIIDNLLSNAIKYSPHGRNIHLTLEQEAGHALIQVRDEGPGISEEDQGKLFRKFTRLSARPTGGEHSTGLGLSIVKHMVEASHGQVGCISRLGEGASFFVCLPLAT